MRVAEHKVHPSINRADDVRLYRTDLWRWAWAPKDITEGEHFDFGLQKCTAVLVDGVMRYKERKEGKHG